MIKKYLLRGGVISSVLAGSLALSSIGASAQKVANLSVSGPAVFNGSGNSLVVSNNALVNGTFQASLVSTGRLYLSNPAGPAVLSLLSAPQNGNYSIFLPTLNSNDTVCLQILGNCQSANSLNGNGATNRLALFNSSNTLTNSSITDDGNGNVTINGANGRFAGLTLNNSIFGGSVTINSGYQVFNASVNIPNVNGWDQFCLRQVNNCATANSLSGNGLSHSVAVFNGSNVLGTGSIYDNGAGNVTIGDAVAGSALFNVGSSNQLTIDSNGNLSTSGSINTNNIDSLLNSPLNIGSNNALSVTIGGFNTPTFVRSNFISVNNANVNGNLVVNGVTENYPAVINDLPSGGVIGDAFITVDSHNAININQQTSGQTLSLPNSNGGSSHLVSATHSVYVSNTGTASFIINGVTLAPGTTAEFYWNGSSWGHLI